MGHGVPVTRAALALAVVLLSTAVARADAPPPALLSLDEALHLGERENRQLAVQALEVAKAHERWRATRTERLPRVGLDVLGAASLTPLTFTFDRGLFGTYPNMGPIPAQTTEQTLARRLDTFVLAYAVQPVTRLRDAAIAGRLAASAEAIERQRLRGARQALASEVRRLYYAIGQTEAAADAADAALAFLAELEGTVAKQAAERAVLRADELEVAARLAGARHTSRALHDSLATRKEQLNLLLGRAIETEFTVAAPEDEALGLVADTARERPDVREAELRLAQSEDDLRLQKAQSIPELSLFAAYLAPSTRGVLPASIPSVGVSLRWEPLTWGRRGAQVAQKKLASEQARTALRETQDAARIEIAQKRRLLAEAAGAVEVARLDQAASEERARVARVRFGENASLLESVLESQATLADANRRLLDARANWANARAELERALGVDDVEVRP